MASLINLALRIYSIGLLAYTVIKNFMPNLELRSILSPFYEPFLAAVHHFMYEQFPDLSNIGFDLSFLGGLILLSALRFVIRLAFGK